MACKWTAELMKCFDLTFKGDILPGFDPDQVRANLAELFQINDPLVLDELFSGDAFILRSNLDRKAAADYFRKMSERGGKAELVTRVVSELSGPEPEATAAAMGAEPGPVSGSTEGMSPPADPLLPVMDDTPAGDVNTLELVEQSSPEPSTPSADEVIQRLQQLQQEAQAVHDDKLEQLQALQEEIKQQTAEQLESIKQRRAQVLLEAEDTKTQLKDLEQEKERLFTEQIDRITEQERALSDTLEQAISSLATEHSQRCEAARLSCDELQAKRQQCQDDAAREIASLEARIAAIRKQCEQDVDSMDRLLTEKEQDIQAIEQGFSAREQELKAEHQSELETFSARREEHTREFRSEQEQLRQRQLEQEIEHEEMLTGLWEEEEKQQHQAQARLQQLEITRKRHQRSLEQRLDRLRKEEEKVGRGELSLT